MPTISLENCELFYNDIPAKNQSDDTLVVLHANPGSHEDYNAVIDELSTTRRVIAINWPGYGGESYFNKPLKSLEEVSPLVFYNILVEAWEKLAISNADLIGNSVGANVAARFAAQYPDKVKSLVLVSPGGFTKHNLFTKTFCSLQASKFSLPSSVFANMYIRVRNSHTKQMLHRAKTAQSSIESVNFSRAMWGSFKTDNNNLLEIAKKIKAPTILFFGLFDPIIPAMTDGKNAQKCIPHANSYILKCGHCAFAEKPTIFIEKLQNLYD